jgi:large subunit ribosomal protein L25
MSDLLLEVQSRDIHKEKNNALRREGFIPAVVYGHAKENKNLKVCHKSFSKIFKGRIASNLFLDLKIDNEDKPSKTVFVKETQKDWRSQLLDHIDFVEINPLKKVRITVPVVLTGESVGVLTFGGVLQFSTRGIIVECLPKDVPQQIKIDIANLNVGQSIHVEHLNFGESVRIITSKEVTIVSVTEKTVQEEAAKTVTAEGAGAAGEGAASTSEGEAKTTDAKGAKAPAGKEAGKTPAGAAKPEAKKEAKKETKK